MPDEHPGSSPPGRGPGGGNDGHQHKILAGIQPAGHDFKHFSHAIISFPHISFIISRSLSASPRRRCQAARASPAAALFKACGKARLKGDDQVLFYRLVRQIDGGGLIWGEASQLMVPGDNVRLPLIAQSAYPGRSQRFMAGTAPADIVQKPGAADKRQIKPKACLV